MYRKAGNCDDICSRCMPFAAYRRRGSSAVRAVIGVSRYILDRHIDAGFFRDASRAEVIYNSVGIAGRGSRRSGARPLVFGFIGRLCREKGIEWLLETFASHARAADRLLVAGSGDGEFVQSLQARFASPAVSFLGRVDPAAFYEQVDVVIVPSLWHEPFGRMAIEALAHGIPVIGTRRGGIPEAIEDGVTGLLVDPDEPDSLAKAMRKFSDSPEWAERFGENGFHHLSRFSEDPAIVAHENLYADAMAQSRECAA
jgi:glycosyltransferase involved in cell wall biosynthesis